MVFLKLFVPKDKQTGARSSQFLFITIMRKASQNAKLGLCFIVAFVFLFVSLFVLCQFIPTDALVVINSKSQKIDND